MILQFGGQTAINLAKPLHAIGVPIFGSDFKSIDIAETGTSSRKSSTSSRYRSLPGEQSSA